MSNDDLMAFIRARLDEDEEFIRAAGPRTNRPALNRFRREAEAKRAILAAHPVTDRVVAYGCRDFPFGCETCHDWDGATEGRGWCETLRALAAVYSDHPDYAKLLTAATT